MPLGRGIVEVFEAIPERIEVSGHGPTWRVTGGSFDAVLTYVREALGDAVVVDREDRSRWWRRVTLTVTKDPEIAAAAPPVETFADPLPGEQADAAAAPGAAAPAEDPAEDPVVDAEAPDEFRSALEEIFAHQEELRATRRGIPEQRSRRH
jgi:hypothetical protein